MRIPYQTMDPRRLALPGASDVLRETPPPLPQVQQRPKYGYTNQEWTIGSVLSIGRGE